MTEEEWLASEDWRSMLAFLSGRWTERKGRLYVCAGMRCLWDLLYDCTSQEAVEVGEEAADGFASEDDLREAAHHAECPTFGFDFEAEHVRGDIAGGWDHNSRRLIEMGVYSQEDLQKNGRIGNEGMVARLSNAADIAYHSLYQISKKGEFGKHLLDHLSSQEEWPGDWLVREIAGNPFRPVVAYSSWLTPNIVALAQTIYEERDLPSGHLDSAHLAVLADTLEKAGCENNDILSHCRRRGPHVRGCWVVDLLLGKE